MFPGRVTLFTDVLSLFADVLTKPADLAIGDHRAPQSGQCKPRLDVGYVGGESVYRGLSGNIGKITQENASPSGFFPGYIGYIR